MTYKNSGFTIKETELAEVLEISHQELDEVIKFFDSDPNDQWELKENNHFIFINKSMGIRLFSEQGAYAIAKYMDENAQKSFWDIIKEFLTKHKEKIRNAFISRKIQENCSSLTVRNNRHFLSKKDIVNILCTSPARFNKAFEDIKKTSNPLKIHEDFDDIDGVRYYSLSGFYKISNHLGSTLTVKDRRSWCEAIEIVGKKTFKLIIDKQTAFEEEVKSAIKKAKSRDKSTCQITGKKRDKFNQLINISAHHIYSKAHYPHVATCLDNLITLSEEIHNEFHAWNGGFQKPCTADDLIRFVNELYPDRYEVILRLNDAKKILKV